MNVQLTVLNPLYIILISCLVNFVSLQRSSSATGIGLGTLDGSISNITSSTGLSDGVAIFTAVGVYERLNHFQNLSLSAHVSPRKSTTDWSIICRDVEKRYASSSSINNCPLRECAFCSIRVSIVFVSDLSTINLVQERGVRCSYTNICWQLFTSYRASLKWEKSPSFFTPFETRNDIIKKMPMKSYTYMVSQYFGYWFVTLL